MALNDGTGKIESLSIGDGFNYESAMKKLEDGYAGLLRPDGSRVPSHWAVFSVGELVVIKDKTFRCAYIGETAILFEPVLPSEALVGGSHD